MKKMGILFLVFVLTTCLFASSVYAKGDSAEGAVEVDLVQWQTGPNWNVVGSVILNTTANGKLVVNLNMDTVPNLEDYDIVVAVRYYPPPYIPISDYPPNILETFSDVLDTNAKGKGNVNVKVDIDPPIGNSNVWVIISVSEQASGPSIPPEYITKHPPAKVPVKDMKGVVKVDIVEQDTWPDWNVVGSAFLNTTADGKLVVNLNMDTTPNLEDYHVVVAVRYYPPPYTIPGDPPNVIGIFSDVLDTNAKGQGNANVMVDLNPSPPPSNSSIWVAISVREDPPPPPYPDYHNMPPPVEVPLK